jgi:DNA-binding transcriptional MerR regulator
MRSNELAELAGVTVRTLRHYHQVGVLPEPQRSQNGYREYSVHDLVRVLRVKRLSALGVQLEAMRGILDSDGGAHEDLLVQLEAEIDAKIAALTKQKQLVSLVRQHNAAPDAPPELARFTELLSVEGLSADMVKADREQTLLLAHLVGDEGMGALVAFLEQISEPAVAGVIRAFVERFATISDDTPTAEVEQFMHDVVSTASMLLRGADPALGDGLVDDRLSALLEQHLGDALTPAQKRVIDELARRLAAASDA